MRSIVQLGHDLGFTVIAEGIETPAELVDVRAADCDLGQGFALAVPSPPDDIAVLLQVPRVPPAETPARALPVAVP